MKNKKQIIRIVATIIAFLALMLVTLVPKLKEKNDRLGSISRLKSIGFCLIQYSIDYTDHFPNYPGAKGFDLLGKNDFLSAPLFYLAPADKVSVLQSGPDLKEENSSYAYLGGGLIRSDEIEEYPMIIEKPWLVKKPYCIVLVNGFVTTSKSMPEVANCEEFIKYLSKGQSSPTWNIILENARAVDKACGK